MVCVKIIFDCYLKIVGRFKIFKPVALERWEEELWILRGEGLPKGVTAEWLGPEKTTEYLAKNAEYRSEVKKNARHLVRNRNWREKRKEAK